ncbi:DnaB-like helicase C-terminal domain-containing protein [Neobacillus sp. OS1-2]|uniref:replicative DNA helicase n=1 Tax=Neobacillus sp. OS1-2 TaxID=3070680 RepID=UPI0027E12664|nr:DnaB-like helicase C-terminal domain-containing protein [Neobacillus sp. OS1-2]WML38676.1 DnaB-like helicase C-terminal domain-containing protein [Neobacillus sp. OS1-2]
MIAEKALLGSFLKANYLIKDTIIRPDHLVDARNRQLLQTMIDLTGKGKNIDIISLSTLANFEDFGGISYLNDLQSFGNAEKFQDYEDLVLEVWKEREKQNILTLAQNEDWEIDKIMTRLEGINQAKLDDYTSIDTALIDKFEAPWTEKSVKGGVQTGIKKLNNMTNGFQDSEVTIIAARPSMGKTDVVIHFAKQAGWQGYLPIIFSLEMPEASITDRLLASTGGFNRMRMRNLNKGLSDEQKEQWPNIITRVSETKIQIFDGAGQSVQEMRAKTRKMVHQFPDRKPIIFIDYLTLIRSAEFYGGNAHLQVTEISKNLKGMAKEFNCPVICLAQLNRSVEQRQEKRPMMSDIRESGSVEQDADLIIFLYREKYYDKNSSSDVLELIVAKNRNGPVGIVPSLYNEYTGEITDVLNQRSV